MKIRFMICISIRTVYLFPLNFHAGTLQMYNFESFSSYGIYIVNLYVARN
jgi:hypothetical protein